MNLGPALPLIPITGSSVGDIVGRILYGLQMQVSAA